MITLLLLIPYFPYFKFLKITVFFQAAKYNALQGTVLCVVLNDGGNGSLWVFLFLAFGGINYSRPNDCNTVIWTSILNYRNKNNQIIDQLWAVSKQIVFTLLLLFKSDPKRPAMNMNMNTNSYTPTSTYTPSYTNPITFNTPSAQFNTDTSYKFASGYQMTQPTPSAMTRSRILQQNRYLPNEPLYNPLKTAVSTDPVQLSMKQDYHRDAAQASLLPTEYRPISYQQVQNIRDNTFMIEQPLRPTSNLQRVEGKQFYVLDSNIKQGTPINEIEFRSRLAASREKERNIVIYEAEDSPEKPVRYVDHVVEDQGPVVGSSPVPVPIRKNKGGKYNLYSCLDQPYERIRRYGCKNLSCPANECIAPIERPYWMN